MSHPVDPIKAACVQQAYPPVASHYKRIASGIAQAVGTGAQIVVLPELHGKPYFCQTMRTDLFEWAESVPGPTTGFLSEQAARYGIVVIGSVFESRAEGIFHNTAVVLGPDGTLLGIYRKMHIPEDPGYHEKFYFTPGDGDFEPVETPFGSLGVLVCWDQWFPEAARLMALKGARVLVYPTAIGWDPQDDNEERRRQYEAWRIIQRAHAVANGMHILCCNRTGQETATDGSGCIDFWGGSFICGPQGELLAQCDYDAGVISADLSWSRCQDVRRLWPFFRDRRIDAYADLKLRWRE